MKIAVVFVGELRDDGFNAAALSGAEAAMAAGGAEIAIESGLPFVEAEIAARLGRLAVAADGVVVVGGQGDAATPRIAAAHPETRFAIVQGSRTGPNLASYIVRQEESAYLAGRLAARLTRTGVVGHLSGHRVRPGLMGRAAYAAGVRDQDAGVRLLTAFCGAQDDNSEAARWSRALIEGGADILFTMLNGARRGAIEACRAAGIRQIGNALDWVARDPELFAASATARIDLGMRRAIDDLIAGRTPDGIVEFGIADGEFAALTLAPDLGPEHGAAMDALAARLAAGLIPIPEGYDGPEFTLAPAAPAGTA